MSQQQSLTTKKGKQILKAWIQTTVQSYVGNHGIQKPDNFSSHYVSGDVLLALLHSYNTNAFVFEQVQQGMNREEKLKFTLDEFEKLGVDRTLDVEDVNESVDDRTIVTYLANVYKVFHTKKEEQPTTSNIEQPTTTTTNIEESSNSTSTEATAETVVEQPVQTEQSDSKLNIVEDYLGSNVSTPADFVKVETSEVVQMQEESKATDSTAQIEATTAEQVEEQVNKVDEPSNTDAVSAVVAEETEETTVKEEPSEVPAEVQEVPAEEPAEVQEVPAEEPAEVQEVPAEVPAEVQEVPIEEPVQEEPNIEDEYVKVEEELLEEVQPEQAIEEPIEESNQEEEEEEVFDENERFQKEVAEVAAFSSSLRQELAALQNQLQQADEEYEKREQELQHSLEEQIPVVEEQEEAKYLGKVPDSSLLDEDQAYEKRRRDQRIEFQRKSDEELKLEEALEDAMNRIEELEAELNSVERVKNRYKDQFLKAFADAQTAERDAIQLRRETHELKREVTFQQGRVNNERLRLEDTKKKYDHEIRLLQDKLLEAEAAVRLSEKQEADFDKFSREKDRKIDDLNEFIRKLETEKRSGEESVRSLTMERDRLASKLATEEQLKNMVEGDVKNMESILEETVRAKRTLQQQVATQQVDIEALRGVVEDSKDAAKQLKIVNISLEKELEEVRKQLVSETGNRGDYETSIAALKYEIKDLKSRLDSNEQVSKQLQVQKFKVTDELTEVQKQLDEQNAELVDLQKVLRRQEREISRVTKDLEVETKKSVELSKNEKSLTEQVIQWKEKVNELDFKLNQEKKEKADMDRKIRELELRLRFK